MGQHTRKPGSKGNGLDKASDLARQVHTATEAYEEYLGHKDSKMLFALILAKQDKSIKLLESVQGSLNSNFSLIKDDLKVIMAVQKSSKARQKDMEEDLVNIQKAILPVIDIILSLSEDSKAETNEKGDHQPSRPGSDETRETALTPGGFTKWEN